MNREKGILPGLLIRPLKPLSVVLILSVSAYISLSPSRSLAGGEDVPQSFADPTVGARLYTAADPRQTTDVASIGIDAAPGFVRSCAYGRSRDGSENAATPAPCISASEGAAVLGVGSASFEELTRIYGNTWLNKDAGDDSGDDSGDDDDDSGDDNAQVEAEAGPLDTFDSGLKAENGLPGVPVVMNKQVEAYIKYFRTRGRKHFEKWLDRSQSYMELMTDILAEEGVPEDLFYIALIESGLSIKARSRARAVGPWQFIKGTAKKYGLRVDWWIDERRDPEKSTRAAAKYFKSLYNRFGSWYLAAAGYNAGEGRIMKAMKRHSSDDIWVITSAPTKKDKKDRRWRKKNLRQETRDYVPKYLAAMTIAKDPEAYGFKPDSEIEAVSYDKVKVPYTTDLRVAAKAAGITVEEVKRLNPELMQWFTPPNYPDYELKLPSGKATEFAENYAKVPAPKRIQFHSHKLKRGENIAKIARLYGTGIKPILYINNLKNLRSLRPGTIILVPVRAAENTKSKKGKNVADLVVTHMDMG